ncbi:MAG: FCD domain-containing protein, partial [Myxococcales bacterium]|nr:FCD domain-containing protein [Myxococcales bacterium]
SVISDGSGGGAHGLARFVDEHGEIIDAIQRRDKRQAVALMKDHVDSSRKRLLDSLAGLAIVP